MADLNQEDVRIQVLINKDTPQGRFQDAVYYSPSEFAALSQNDIETLKNKRASDWVKAVQTASAIDYVPTEEELTAQKEALLAELSKVDEKLAEVTSTVLKGK